MTRLALLAAFAGSVFGAGSLCATDFFVSPTGDDKADGTRGRPFATLVRARDAARGVTGGAARRIVMRGGHYFNVSATLTPRDSNLAIEAAPGETPVLFGGQPVSGWVPDGAKFYSAKLPPFPDLPAEALTPADPRRWEIRALQADGRWCPRARWPAQGTFTHLTSFDVPWMSSTGGGWKRKPTAEELTTLQCQAADLPEKLDLQSAEITVYHMWDESCVGIAARDTNQPTLTLSPAPGHPPGAFGVKQYVLWNLREGLTAPGQWYHDRSQGRVVYWPLPGQDMRKTQVIVPTVTTILCLRGSASAPVRDITVRGLTFAVTTVPLQAGGFAAASYAGAISLDRVEHCTLSGLTVTGAAGQGINTPGRRATKLTIEDSTVAHCGAGGIYAGGNEVVIRNNLVHAVGLSYPSAVGIFRGGNHCQVSHNEVHDCTYSAINYGGTGNIIADNLLYDCMKVLHDGAAVYVFAATNCVIRGNVARDITDRGGYGASAYYLDERSTGCVVEGNLALRVGWPSHNHMATNNLIRNNVFITAGDAKLTFPRSTGFGFEKNILQATGNIRVEGANAVTNWSQNLFFSGSGRIEQVTLSKYSKAGTNNTAPGDTVVADPCFRDVGRGDYRFAPDSPAWKLGIAPLEISRAGRERR